MSGSRRFAKGPHPGDVSAMLATRMEEVIGALGLDGARAANRFRFMAPWPNRDKKAACDCYVSGAKIGAWIHWTGDLRGDALDLVAACLDGTGRKDRTRGEAYLWALQFLGLAAPKGESEQARLAREERTRQRTLEARQRQAALAAKVRAELAAGRGRHWPLVMLCGPICRHAAWMWPSWPACPVQSGWRKTWSMWTRMGL
jgi:hypothetical protein